MTPPQKDEATDDGKQKPGILTRAATLRALLLGVAASVFVNFFSPYTESTGFSNFSWSYLSEGAAFPFILLIPLNLFIGRLRPKWALTIPELLLVFVMGPAGMLALTALRNRFVWWPVHPIGFATVSSFTMYAVYIPYLLAWLLKTAMLQWGGFTVYRTATPFFIGLSAGHYILRAIALTGYTVFRIRWNV